VADSGGPCTSLISPDTSRGEAQYWLPYFLPNGKDFLFQARNTNPEESEIRAASLDGGTSKFTLKVQSRHAYAAPGYLFFVRHSILMAQPFDVKRLILSGQMLPVVQSVANNPT